MRLLGRERLNLAEERTQRCARKPLAAVPQAVLQEPPDPHKCILAESIVANV